nr:hypothetical protein [Tanacetum cinerariifolium]
MVIELGSFDTIIRMDWLSRYDAAILCGEKKFSVINAYSKRSILFFTNNTEAPYGDELGRIKPFSDNSYSWSDNSFISDGAKRYGARDTGAAPGIRSIRNPTFLGGESP